MAPELTFCARGRGQLHGMRLIASAFIGFSMVTLKVGGSSSPDVEHQQCFSELPIRMSP
jgi:hypothetical protein